LTQVKSKVGALARLAKPQIN